jgi:hypothetical protein
MAAHISPNIVPAVLCPTCTQYMRLTEIAIDADHNESMRYLCVCGFEYEQSRTVAGERQRTLQESQADLSAT